jgi:hypothetical protein
MMVSVHLDTAGGDVLDLDRTARQLRRELLALDLEDISFARVEAPAGSRGDAVTVSTLILTLTNSAVLVAACQVLRAWVLRAQGRRVSVRYGDKRVEITGATGSQQQQVIDAAVRTMLGDLDKPSNNDGGQPITSGDPNP